MEFLDNKLKMELQGGCVKKLKALVTILGI
jgi:hypothetical protein